MSLERIERRSINLFGRTKTSQMKEEAKEGLRTGKFNKEQTRFFMALKKGLTDQTIEAAIEEFVAASGGANSKEELTRIANRIPRPMPGA